MLETTDKELYLDFVDMAGIHPTPPLALHQLAQTHLKCPRKFTQLTYLIAPTHPNANCCWCCGPCLAWYLSQLGSEEESEAERSFRTSTLPTPNLRISSSSSSAGLYEHSP